MRVGLFGGTFDPAHSGHAHVAELALIRLRLHRVVWLVSPQNPLKTQAGHAPLGERMASARRQARGPSMIVSDFESRVGVHYSVDTLRALKARFPGVRFVWIMGGDNLAGFHLWKGWADIVRLTPIAVIARPGSLIRSRTAPMARRFAHAHRPADEVLEMPTSSAPAWIYLNGRLNPVSSTALRRAGAQIA